MGFLFWVIVTVLMVVPFLKLLPHFGVPSYWAFVAIIPVGGLVLLWVMWMKLQQIERR